METKIPINLENVQETLLLPLWGRAVESQKKHPKLVDNKAIEIVGKIDYDFSTIANNISWISQLAWVARCLHVDTAIRNFMKVYPNGTIVNIGCGLDTTFERIDNGKIAFYDLDLPNVVALRKQFVSNIARRRTIAGSFLETDWFEKLPSKKNVLFIAAGVFYYFGEDQIREFFVSLADDFERSELYFDCSSPLGVRVANKKVIKDGGMSESAVLKWGIRSPREITKWHDKIGFVNQIPMFKGFKKGYSLRTRYGLWLSDILNIMSMVHLKIGHVNNHST
jgi:O-methyltransferase involved in polyketide biosynthesis